MNVRWTQVFVLWATTAYFLVIECGCCVVDVVLIEGENTVNPSNISSTLLSFLNVSRAITFNKKTIRGQQAQQVIQLTFLNGAFENI